MTITELVSAQAGKTYLFVGTYTANKPDKGIYIYEFNTETGNAALVTTAENITNPSFLALSPDGRYIYACTDTKMPTAGSVSSFRFDNTNNRLTFLNEQDSGGENPVYLTTDKNNDYVINANYTEGTVSVFPVNPDGRLGSCKQRIKFEGSSVSKRQDKAHIHAAVFSPDNRYLFFPDLGADKIRTFKFDARELQPLKPIENNDFKAIPGSGPRHFTFHPNNRFAYCVEELSGMVTVFNYENGKLDSIQRIFSYSKLQEEYNSADIHISNDGLFLYASNRWDQENTISIFSIDPVNGKLTFIAHQPTFGETPRSFTLDPTGNFLLVANQHTNNIIVFKRDLKTGLLEKTGEEIQVPNPSCLKMRRYGG